MKKFDKYNFIMLQLIAFFGGATLTSIFVTKSHTWYFTLPVCLLALTVIIVRLIRNK